MQSLLPYMLAGTLLGTGLAIARSSTDDIPPAKTPPVAKFDTLFHAADQDGDGAWNKDEALNARLHRILEHFDRLDANGDGKLTRDETRALVRRPSV